MGEEGREERWERKGEREGGRGREGEGGRVGEGGREMEGKKIKGGW